MRVKLVSVTQPLIAIPSDENEGRPLTAEELIVYIARVSNPKNQNNFETSDRLLNYLVKHKHWSPFEMVNMCVEIKTSRAIAQQILRHRSFSYQEFSQRYSIASDFEPVQLRRQAEKNRQSSEDSLYGIANAEARELVDKALSVSIACYEQLIDRGVAKECARMVLPLTTATTL